MARIDTSKIEGYADMSAEDKLKALEGYNIPDPDYSGYVKKDMFDKTAHELAAKKKELAAKMSDDERAKLESEAAQKELNEKYEALLRENNISKTKAKYMALGYDEKLAESTATAVADGDIEKVLKNEKTYLDGYAKSIRTEALKDTPKPTGGSGSNEMTLKKYRSMSGIEQDNYYRAHPDEVKELYKNEGNE